MHSILKTLLVGTVLAVGGIAVASAASAKDPIIGTWQLNVAKSKFSPGPAPKSHTRTYMATADGIELTYETVAADGSATSGKSSYKYDGKDYEITGSSDFDTVALKRVDDSTVESTQKKAGKVVGATTRTVSKDGKVMTLKLSGKNAKGEAYDHVMVFDKQ